MAFPYNEVALVLKDTSYYLGLTNTNHLLLSQSYGVFHPNCKFSIENASDSAGDWAVHIRCCKNNKYWTGVNFVLMGIAKKPVEILGGTIFRAELSGDNTLKLHKVMIGGNTNEVRKFGNLIPAMKDLLSIRPDSLPLEFHVIDYRRLVKLPKRVCFKTHVTNKYLGHRYAAKRNYNQFADEDLALPTAGYEIIHARNGDVFVKSTHVNRLWSVTSNWVWSDVEVPIESNIRALFQVIKVSDKKIALRNRQANRFCAPLIADGLRNCLNATALTMTEDTHIEVVEPIRQRTITVTDWREEDARVYNEKVLHYSSRVIYNGTSSPATQTVEFSDTVDNTRSWSTSQTLQFGTTFTLTTGVPELNLGGSVTIGNQITQEYTWNDVKTIKKTIGSKQVYTVDRRTKKTATMIVKRADFVVPFSYSETVVYSNGDPEVNSYDDGLFHGVSVYSFEYDSKDEPLPALYQQSIVDNPVVEKTEPEPEPALEDSSHAFGLGDEVDPVLSEYESLYIDDPTQDILNEPALTTLDDASQSVVDESAQPLDEARLDIEEATLDNPTH